jgi:transcriptional regulator with XRE-family HTH domain
MAKIRQTNMEVAERLGCDHSMVSRMRSGDRSPSIAMLTTISAEYNVSLQTLVRARLDGPEAMVACFERIFG